MKKVLLLSIAVFLTINLNAQRKGSLTDTRDGKTYETIKIGNHEWMAENLAYKTDRGNYWAYDNNKKNIKKYGYLYDWQTADNVCPVGWRLPSDADWTLLTKFLGNNPGNKLKAKRGWECNGSETDKYGFGALPGGYRTNNGLFDVIGKKGNWWSSTEYPASYGESRSWSVHMNCHSNKVYRSNMDKQWGFSVRCIKE